MALGHAGLNPEEVDYINDIRSWFEKNSVGELHDQNRPLEMLMLPDRVCTLLNEIDTLFSYVIYKKIKFNKTFGIIFLSFGLLFLLLFGGIISSSIIKKIL